jgi:hypothetical protein
MTAPPADPNGEWTPFEEDRERIIDSPPWRELGGYIVEHLGDPVWLTDRENGMIDHGCVVDPWPPRARSFVAMDAALLLRLLYHRAFSELTTTSQMRVTAEGRQSTNGDHELLLRNARQRLDYVIQDRQRRLREEGPSFWAELYALKQKAIPAALEPITKGKRGRRGYPIKALNYARKLRQKHPGKKAAEIRGECLKKFDQDDLPPLESFLRWMNRKRAN